VPSSSRSASRSISQAHSDKITQLKQA
jgi:hypothetical protein